MIKKMILIMMLVIPLTFADFIEIRLSKNYDGFNLIKTQIYSGVSPKNLPGNSEYTAVLYDIQNSVIDNAIMTIPGPLIIERDLINNISGEVIDTDSKNLSLFFGYDPKVRNLVVQDQKGSVVFTVDLIRYNKCNVNHICDASEYVVLCPEDCTDKTNNDCVIKEDGVCDNDPDCVYPDPDCITFPENEQKVHKNVKIIYFAVIALIISVIIILIKIKRR